MCGIAGLHPARPTDPEALAAGVRKMTQRLVHRGPDESGDLVRSEVSLGSRRLKIIDLAGGRMPIANEDGSVHVVYNGEIYNFRSLRKSLQARGHTFATAADTEVLVHLYEEEGIDFVHRLNGMFAFALWDARTNELFLVRDRLGIKPLYYAHGPDGLSFASELGALVAGGWYSTDLDQDGLMDFMALGYVRAPRTIYRACRKLPPGCILRSREGEVEIRRYWEVPRATEDPSLDSVDAALEELDETLRAAVHDRLIADVPLGAFLSGGVDSSLMVAYASEGVSGPLATFSVGFEGDDELPFARMVAERFGTDHHELVLGPEDCRVLDKLVESFGEPFGDASAIPTYFVSRLARSEVTVSISGDGGDELFGGYDRYVRDDRLSWADSIPRVVRRACFGLPGRLLPPGAYGVNRLRALSLSRDERYCFLLSDELDPRRGGVMNEALAARVPARGSLFGPEFGHAGPLPYPARLQHVDAISYLPDDILVKVDRMSMTHSLEARVPILDHRVVDFARRIPTEWRVRGGQGKWLLKRLAERYLPREVIFRPKKGFSLPMDRWMREDIQDFAGEVLEANARVRPYLSMESVRRIVREHRSGRRDHSGALWRIIFLEQWLKHATSHPAGPTLATSDRASVPASSR